MRPSENIPLSPRIHSRTICDTPIIYPSLPEYTALYTSICDPPRIYPSSQNMPPFKHLSYLRHSKNIPFPPRIYSPLKHLCATLPEYTTLSRNIPPNYMRHSHNLHLPPRTHRPFKTAICDRPEYTLLPRIYPSLS